MDEKKLFVKVKCYNKTDRSYIKLINLSELANTCNSSGSFDLSTILDRYSIDRDTKKVDIFADNKNVAAD